MREREKKWRKKTQAQGRKQIARWLDGDTYQALQALIQAYNLRGMGEAIRLLVDSHQAAQTSVQGRDSEDLGQSNQTQAEPGQAASALQERTPDTQRCECRTSTGRRCRNKTTVIIKVRVNGGIGEFGSCKRHVRDFEPYSPG